MMQEKNTITAVLCFIQICLISARYMPSQRLHLRPGFIQQRVLQYRGPSQAFYRNPMNRILSSLHRQPTPGLRSRPLRAKRLLRNEHPPYNSINRIKTREPLRPLSARRPLNNNFKIEFSNVGSGKSKDQIDDNNRTTRRVKSSRPFTSNIKWRKTPVSLNLGEKFLRRRNYFRKGSDGTFRLGGNEYARRHRISIKSSRGRNIHISHFAEPNGRSRIIINTGLGSSEHALFNGKSDNKSPSRANSNAATWSHKVGTKTNGTDLKKKLDNQIVSTESATNTDGTNTHTSKKISVTPSSRKFEKSQKKTDNLSADAAKTTTTKSNKAIKVNNDSVKQLSKVKEHSKSANAAISTPVILTNKTKGVKKIRAHPSNFLEPQLHVSTTEGPDLPDGPDGPDTPDGNDEPDTA